MKQNGFIFISLIVATLATTLVIPAAALAQEERTGAAIPATKGKAKFNAASPAGATINANGQPLGNGSKIAPQSSSAPANVPNLSNGTAVNPYTGVAVGQPLRPNDIGDER